MTTTTRQVFAIATIAAASLLSAGAAFAQEATPDTWLSAAQTTKSRADVSAELFAARKTGLTKANGSVPIASQDTEPVTADTVVPKVRKLNYAAPLSTAEISEQVTEIRSGETVIVKLQG